VARLAKVFPTSKVSGEVVLIFLTVGTWRKGFDRLVKAVDELVGGGVIIDEVIAQIGYGSYKPNYLKTIDFCSPDEFEHLISRAKVLISHAGVGTMALAIKRRKPVIVVPRKVSLGEVDNDHQFTTARHLEAEGKILVAYEVSELPAKLEQAKTFVPIGTQDSHQILHVVQEFIDSVVEKKHTSRMASNKDLITRIWPYQILRRDDNDIKADLDNIIQHFATKGQFFDTIVFIPNVGRYLGRLFREMFNDSFEVNFVTVRRASSRSNTNFLKELVFRQKWLSNIMRHVEVLWRLIKYILRLSQKMVTETLVDFDVKNKEVLVIDDDVATGSTLEIVKTALLRQGASSVTTASISNHLLPNKIKIDYSVYKYKLLRTKNSRDYYAI